MIARPTESRRNRRKGKEREGKGRGGEKKRGNNKPSSSRAAELKVSITPQIATIHSVNSLWDVA